MLLIIQLHKSYIILAMTKLNVNPKMHVLWVCLCHLLLLLFAKTNAKVPAIIVFGDSTADTGNNNFIPTIAQSNFAPYGRDFIGGHSTGRFSNGRLPCDFISEAFGLRPTVPAYLDPTYNISDFAIGVSFASAGTGLDNATSDVADVIPLWKEVEYYKEYQSKLKAYLGDEKAMEILNEALYLVSIGTNDFLENYYTLPNRRSHFTIEQYEIFLIELARNFMLEIYNLGARKISFTGVPPMGCLPLERATNFMDNHECNKGYNNLALDFNGKLKDLVDKLNKEVADMRLVFSDAHNILLNIITNPSSYGFEVAAMGCCGTGRFEMSYLCNRHNPCTCADANKFVFWDAFHPSERTYRIISDYLIHNYLCVFL